MILVSSSLFIYLLLFLLFYLSYLFSCCGWSLSFSDIQDVLPLKLCIVLILMLKHHMPILLLVPHLKSQLTQSLLFNYYSPTFSTVCIYIYYIWFDDLLRFIFWSQYLYTNYFSNWNKLIFHRVYVYINIPFYLF